jgi:hypothetical protein
MPQPGGRGVLVVGAGRGPKPGAPNAGRPPDEWRERLRSMASRDEVLAHVESVLLQGPEHPFFDRALQYVTDHGYGKPKQELAHSGTLTLEALLAASLQPRE